MVGTNPSHQAWYDAKLISIHKKEHNPNCGCTFEVQFYHANETDLLGPPNLRPLVLGEVGQLNIEQLGIFQKPFLADMHTGTQAQSVSVKIWSVDSKMLPWPILADISKSMKPLSDCKEICVCETKSKPPIKVASPDTTLLCQEPHRTFKRRVAATTNQRMRGVNIATHTEQAQEASLLEIAKVEPREMINRRQSSNGALGLQNGVGASASSRDYGKLLVNHRKVTCALSEECGCFALESDEEAEMGLTQVKIESRKLTLVDSRQNTLSQQRVDPGQYMHCFSAQGVKSFMTCEFEALHAQPEGGFPHLKARRNFKRYGKTAKVDRRFSLLSSLIDSAIQENKRGWQRRVSILISKPLSTSRIMERLQLALTRKAPRNSKALNCERMLAICTTAPSKKMNSLRSQEEVSRKKCKLKTDVHQFVEDTKSAFNEFFKRAMKKDNIKEAAACLDWSKLTPKNSPRLLGRSSSPLPQGTGPLHKPSYLSPQESEREGPPKEPKTVSKDFPLKRKQRQGQKDSCNTLKRKRQKLEVSFELRFSKFSFHELLRKAKEEYELPITDWSRLPPKRAFAHQVPWDPIIFHDDLLDHGGNPDKEESLLECLWHEMEFVLTRDNFHAEHEEYNLTLQVNMMLCEEGHDFVLEENEGLVCKVCGLVGCSIEAMLPVKVQGKTALHPNKHEESLSEDDDDDIKLRRALDIVTNDEDEGSAWGADNQLFKDASKIHSSVWDLIPELKDKMHAHQRDGFEFLWRSLAGSMGPSNMESSARQDIGGCIISHAPGTGKTFLIISFLQSFMQLNPNCKPLILAPTIMLRPWQLEFKKWEVNVPIHVLNSSRDARRKRLYKDQDQTETFTLASGSRISGKNLIDMHRIKAVSDWFKEDSILMVSYPLFARLTDDTNPKLSAVSRNIGRLLLQSPGLLVLDEGHLARNHESKLRKSLTRVQTRLRILLSGTIFQNNCCELFNTFHLVRPTFMRDVYHSQKGLKHGTPGEHFSLQASQGELVLRPRNAKQVATLKLLTQSRDVNVSSDDEDMESMLDTSIGTDEEIEARTRRLFMDKIGKTLESGQRKRGKVLEDAIKRLRSMTGSFVHYYAGEVLQSLPGLKDYTVLLKPSPMQESLLHEIVRVWDRANSLDFEYIVSSVCIHPYLFKHVSCKESCARVNLAAIGDLVRDPKEGVKVKFIMELVQLCQVKNEKLLIFSQNIQPLRFLEELLKSDRKYLKGDRALILDGSLPLDDRQGVIDSFNEYKGNVRVLLASTKACGEGITLTGASRVVFLDTVWNPAVTKQAMSRAFRLGQRKEVFVYRLVASGTLEEDKYNRTIWKDWLSRSIFVSSTNGEITEGKLGNLALDNITSSKEMSLSLLSKARGLHHGLSGAPTFDDDTILSTILELERDDRSIVDIVKHDSCLDQGHTEMGDGADRIMEESG